MKSNIFLEKEAREKLLSGITKLNNVVKSTIGPRGKYVLYDEYGPKIVNDGATIADIIKLEDKAENLAARLIINISKRANEKAGDGTTTATILAYNMIKKGLEKIEQGTNPLHIRNGMNNTYKKICSILKKQSIKISSKKDIENIAFVSSNDKEVGKLLAEVLEKVTKNGTISIQEGNKTETEVEFSQGMQLDKGFISHLMANSKNEQYVNHNVLIFITNFILNSVEDVIKILEIAGGKSLIIVAEDITGFALTTLVMNAKKLNLVAIKAPSFGENRYRILEDISILTNANFFSKEKGMDLKKITKKDFGVIDFLKVSSKETIIVVEKESELIANKKKELENKLLTSNLGDQEKSFVQDRLAKIVGGVCVIKVGAASEAEMKAKKFKLEDALNASKASLEEGIICGGGIGLVNIYKEIKDLFLPGEENVGMEIVKSSLFTPLKEIVNNANYSEQFSIKEVIEKNNFGLDARDLKMVHMYDAGIIDPVKVIRLALESAIKGASIILTTGTIVVDEKEDNRGNYNI